MITLQLTFSFFFFFNDTATTEIYTLSLHDALPILRAWSDRAALPILDLYPFGSTSPIYVRVGREPVRSREDAEFFVRWIDRLDQAARAHEAWNTSEEREHVLRLLAQARGVYAEQAGAR